MSDLERPRSRSSSRSPRQDSWYMLVQEEVLVSSPTPSPRRSLTSSGSRSSSKASSVSSTPRPLQTTSSTAAAEQSPASLLQSTTLSQHPLEEEIAALTQYPLEESLDERQRPSGTHHSKHDDAHIDVISPLGGVPESNEAAPVEQFAPPPLNLDTSLDSQDGDKFRGLAKGTFPFVEEDESAAMSSDTDINIPLSDNEEDESGFPVDAEDFGVSKDAVQEAIAEVSADFVSGVLSMSVSQHSVEGTKGEYKMKVEDNGGAADIQSMVIEDVHSSAATTPWQSEGGMEQPTPSPFNQDNNEMASDQIPREEQTSQQSHVSDTNSHGSNWTKSSMDGNVRSEISERTASPTIQLKLLREDMTKGSPSKLPLDLDSLQPLDIGEHMASGAEVVILRGSGEEYLCGTERRAQETQRQQEMIPRNHLVDQRSMAEDRNQRNADFSAQNQRVSLEPDSRGSLPSQYLSPSEGNVSRDAQSYIHYPRDLQGSPRNIGFSSDNDSNFADMPQGSTRNARDVNVSQSRRDQGTERDLLARRVALLLQVNSDMDAGVGGRRANFHSGSLSGSGSSSHTGSPDSIEEATLPLGILSKDSHGSPSSYRRGDGQSLPPPSRSESSGSSNADSLAEHVKKLLQESESMRKLHAAGISPQQLLSIQAEMGKSSPTLSEASTSSSVRDIVNRVARHSRTGSESDDSVVRPQEAYMSPSHPLSGSTTVPLGSSSGLQESTKVTFQDTFQANRSHNAARSGNTSQSSSTLTNDSLSQRVQQLLSLADDALTHQPDVASERLSREDLLALVQIAELEKKISESRSTSQMQGSPRSSQNSRMSSTRDAISRSTSAKENSVASTDSLALRVQAILGREPPGERVDRIISEALNTGDPLVYERNLSNSSLDSKYSTAKPQRISSEREFEDPLTTDATQRPFGAFDRAKDMLTLHLQRLEEKTFDHSVDTRTPFRQDNNANMIMNRAEYDTLTQNPSQQLSEHDFQTQSSGSLSKPISTDQVFYGLLPEQIPSHLQMPHDQSTDEFHVLQSVDSPARPKSWQGDPRQLYPQYQSSGRYQSENDNMSPGQDSQVMDDSLFAMQRSNSSPDMKVEKKSFTGAKVTSSSSHQRSGSWGRTNQFEDLQQQQTSRIPGSKLPVLSHGQTKQGQQYPQERQQEYRSPPSSQTPQHLPSQQQHRQVHPDYSTNSWPRSLSKSRSGGSPTTRPETSPRTEQRQSFGKDSSATEGFLKPYRPPGSSDVIYTYPVDGQTVQDGSPSRSVSTLESSHAGSNDANAPNFPVDAYGSRPSQDSPHTSKIPRYDRGPTSPVRSPHERSRGQGLYVDDHKGGRSYRRSFSDSSRQEQVREKEKVGRQISLSPQHRPGRSRTSGVKREHSKSPPESVPYGQMSYNQRQAYEMETSGMQPRDRSIAGHPVRDRAALERGGIGGQEGRERFGYRAQPRPLSWDPSRQSQPMDYRGAYPQDTQYRQQYGIPSGMAPVPPASTTDATSPSKIPRFRSGSEQSPLRYMPVGAERAERQRPEYTDRQFQEYGQREVPQLPGTYSRQVLEDILQDESDPLYREASIMWDQYQRLQQQKEARREARREVKGQDESDVSSLDSRRVNRLAHLVQDPVQHTVQHFVGDETDSHDSSSTTQTDSTTPRQRRKWVRDQQGFTPREQSPDRMARNGEFQRRVSPEEIAAIVQTSPTKESRIPRVTTRQNGQQHDKRKRRDEKHSSKRSPEQEPIESTLGDNITQEALSNVLTATEETLLTDMSLESDRLLELLGPDGIRKLSSKLVKLQRKIDRQREHHRKRTEEQSRDQQSTKTKAHRHDVPVSSTPAVDDLSSTATSGTMEEVSDTVGANLRVGKQTSLEPSLSPVQEAHFQSTEDTVYDTTESTPPEASIPDRKITRQGRVIDNGQTAKRSKDFAHHDDFGVTYTTDSFSDAGSDTSIPCACKPKRSHSIHGFTSRAREHATDKMSKENKLDTERDEVFKKPSKSLSRIPVRDSDPTSRNGSAAAGPAQDKPQKVKPGTAFVIDVGRGDRETGKDTVLTGKQNYSNKDVEEEDEERRRRRNERIADKQIQSKENEAPSRIPKKIVQPVAWFQPIAKKMPWQQDTPTKAKPQPMSFPVKDEETAPKTGDKASLQDAFEKHRSDFISKSRERQRKMRLAAEERHTQAQFELEREQIFHDQRSKKPNPNAHPLSDQLHKPKKRALSKKQMKEHTEKLYNRLPEVKQKEKERKKAQDSNLNRIRAQMYRKKLSDKVKGKPFPGS